MEDFLYLFTFQDSSIAFVVIGITLLGLGSAYVGTYSFLDKKALLGDAISHAVLPGVVMAYILGIPFGIGAFVAAMLAVVLIGYNVDILIIK